MATEVITNSPTPGSVVSIATVATALTNSSTTLKTSGTAPTALRGAGTQFRIVIDSEIILVTAGAETTAWTIARGQEGSTAAAHAIGAPIYHDLTAEALTTLIAQAGLQFLKGKVAPAVTPSGSTFKPDFSLGSVFPIKTTGTLEFEFPPSNIPVTGSLLVAYLVVEGKSELKFKGFKGWLYGSQPPYEATGSTRLDFITGISIDGGANWYGAPGIEPLPSDVPRVSTVADQQMLVFNATSGKFEGRTVPTSLTLEAIKGLIAELGIPQFPGGTKKFPLSNDEELVEWADFHDGVLALAAGVLTFSESLTTSKALPETGNVFYPIAKKGITLKLPSVFAVVQGSLLIFENTDVGAAHLEGRFTPGSEAVTTIDIQPGELIAFFCDLSALHWRIQYRRRSPGDIVELVLEGAATKTSNQITKAFEQSFTPEKPPLHGQAVIDFTNKVTMYFNITTSKWHKSAAMVEIA